MANDKSERPAIDADEVKRLLAENAALKAENEAIKARPVPEVQGFLITNETEVQIGEDEDGNPRYLYKVDLPPSGGIDVRINGVSFYHGQQYEIGLNTLRTLKDIVARAWGHELNIKGSNENFYRRPIEQTLRGNRR